MKIKKFTMFIIIIFLLVFILWIGFILIKNHKNNKNSIIKEYTPEQEISEEQLRTTNIVLYFYDEEAKDLGTEIRQIDSKKLLNNPEKILIEYLIAGPENNNLKKLIPENTKIINIELIKDNLCINFSKEFNTELNEEKIEIIKKSILKTVSQLNEINSIKLLIENEKI